MKIIKIFLTVPLLASLFVFGCDSDDNPTLSGNGDGTENNAVTPGPDVSGIVTAPVRTTLNILSRAYTSSENLWAGFNALDNPSVVVFRDSEGKTTSIVALNFQSLSVLGTSEAIDVQGAPYTAVKVTEPSSDLEARIGSLQNFEFTANVGGVSTYMIAVTEGDEALSPDTFDFGQYFIHEMFHRYQILNFTAPQVDQSLATYPFTANNLEFAILEERALKAALETSDNDARNNAIKHFSALRLARRTAEIRVSLDDSQESYEGSARYLEHKMAGNDTAVFNNQGSFATNLVTSPGENFTGVKDHFGFGRFYSSGAAVIELIERVGVSNYQNTIQNGEYVASVLIAYSGVETDDVAATVQAARNVYDSQGALAMVVQAMVATAATEPDSLDGGPGQTQTEDEIDITPEQSQCLEDLGYRLDDPEVGIPQSAIDQCITDVS